MSVDNLGIPEPEFNQDIPNDSEIFSEDASSAIQEYKNLLSMIEKKIVDLSLSESDPTLQSTSSRLENMARRQAISRLVQEYKKVEEGVVQLEDKQKKIEKTNEEAKKIISKQSLARMRILATMMIDQPQDWNDFKQQVAETLVVANQNPDDDSSRLVADIEANIPQSSQLTLDDVPQITNAMIAHQSLVDYLNTGKTDMPVYRSPVESGIPEEEVADTNTPSEINNNQPISPEFATEPAVDPVQKTNRPNTVNTQPSVATEAPQQTRSLERSNPEVVQRIDNNTVEVFSPTVTIFVEGTDFKSGAPTVLPSDTDVIGVRNQYFDARRTENGWRITAINGFKGKLHLQTPAGSSDERIPKDVQTMTDREEARTREILDVNEQLPEGIVRQGDRSIFVNAPSFEMKDIQPRSWAVNYSKLGSPVVRISSYVYTAERNGNGWNIRVSDDFNGKLELKFGNTIIPVRMPAQAAQKPRPATAASAVASDSQSRTRETTTPEQAQKQTPTESTVVENQPKKEKKKSVAPEEKETPIEIVEGINELKSRVSQLAQALDSMPMSNKAAEVQRFNQFTALLGLLLRDAQSDYVSGSKDEARFSNMLQSLFNMTDMYVGSVESFMSFEEQSSSQLEKGITEPVSASEVFTALRTTPLMAIEFTDDGCADCETAESIIQNLSNTIPVVKVNISNPQLREIMAVYNIQGTPSTLLFKKGQEIDRAVGSSNIGNLYLPPAMLT